MLFAALVTNIMARHFAAEGGMSPEDLDPDLNAFRENDPPNIIVLREGLQDVVFCDAFGDPANWAARVADASMHTAKTRVWIVTCWDIDLEPTLEENTLGEVRAALIERGGIRASIVSVRVIDPSSLDMLAQSVDLNAPCPVLEPWEGTPWLPTSLHQWQWLRRPECP